MALPADLVLYASLNMPEDDTATSGGAIDPDYRLTFTQIATLASIEVVSSSAADTTQQVTAEVLDDDGVTVSSQTVTLTGVTAVDFSTLGTISAVLQVTMSADAAGIVTLQTDGAAATIGTIPVGERGFLCVHREATASAGSAQDFYYKGFWKNTGAGTLTAGTISEASDPTDRVTFALAASVNDTASVANRKTAPALTFNNTAKAIPASLTPGDAIGVWFKFSHPAGDSDYSSTVSSQVSGTP